MNKIFVKGDFLDFLLRYQHRFVCRSSDSTVSEDAGTQDSCDYTALERLIAKAVVATVQSYKKNSSILRHS
jgi:hypothetical protein